MSLIAKQKKFFIAISMATVLGFCVGASFLWIASNTLSTLAFKGQTIPLFDYHKYWRYYDLERRPRISQHLLLSLFVPFVFFVFIIFLIWYITKERLPALYGDARWATLKEMKASNLFIKEGITLAKHNFYPRNIFLYKKKHIKIDTPQHIVVYAPTRSGKGVGVVIPTLLDWKGSCVVLDIKLENYEVTSNYRQNILKQDVYLWAPGNKFSNSYNPLCVVDKNSPTRIDEIQKIANYLCPDPDKGDTMWAAEGRNLFIAATLAVADLGYELNLSRVNRWIKETSPKEMNLLINQGKLKDPVCIANLKNYIQMAGEDGEGKQGAGVKSQLSSLSALDNPYLAASTSNSSFNFEKKVDGEILSTLRCKPTTIYVGITPDNLKRYKPFLNLFFQQCIDKMMKMPTEKEPHSCLFLMDEFTSLGRMDLIKDGIAFFAGYQIRLLPIIQSLAQLEIEYTPDGARSMIANFAYRLIYTPNEQKDAENLSKELGKFTMTTSSRSKSKGGGSISYSDHGRDLMTPDEVKRMPKDRAIIFMESERPIYTWKNKYYDDPVYAGKFYNLKDRNSTKHLAPIFVPDLDLVAEKAKEASDNLEQGEMLGKLKALEMENIDKKVTEIKNSNKELVEEALSSFFEQVNRPLMV